MAPDGDRFIGSAGAYSFELVATSDATPSDPVRTTVTIRNLANDPGYEGLKRDMLAWLTERTDLPGARLWAWLAVAPLAISMSARGLPTMLLRPMITAWRPSSATPAPAGSRPAPSS